ncbi:MAG: hypothetical protein ABFE08_10005 [Armatimonadia bacterium]
MITIKLGDLSDVLTLTGMVIILLAKFVPPSLSILVRLFWG